VSRRGEGNAVKARMRSAAPPIASFLLWLVVVSPGQAKAQSAEVKHALASARAFYENLDYEQALAQLKRVEKRAQSSSDSARLSLFEGILQAYLGREEKATQAFLAGLTHQPDAKLPVEVSPKVESLFSHARARVKRKLREEKRVKREVDMKPLPPQHVGAAKTGEGKGSEEFNSEEEAAEESASEDEGAERRATEARSAQVDVGASSGQRPVGSSGLEGDWVAFPGANLSPPGKPSPPASSLSHPLASPLNFPRSQAWLPAAGGVACGLAAGTLLILAKLNYDALDTGMAAPSRATQIREQGKQQQLFGYGLLGVGAAALLTSGAMFVWGGGEARPSVFLAPDHASVGVAGVLP